MFAFLLTLMVMRNTRTAPCGAGCHPEDKPPDLDSGNLRNNATAYYWDMYVATVATYNAELNGAQKVRPFERLVGRWMLYVAKNKRRKMVNLRTARHCFCDVGQAAVFPYQDIDQWAKLMLNSTGQELDAVHPF